MNVVTLVVMGSSNTQKKQFIRSVCGSNLLSQKNMDYGQIDIDDELMLQFFGTAGQQKFSFMWETLSKNVLGFIVFVGGSIDETKKNLDDLRKYAPKSPLIIAVPNDDLISDLRELVDNVLIVECIVTNTESSRVVVVELMKTLAHHTFVERIIAELS